MNKGYWQLVWMARKLGRLGQLGLVGLLGAVLYYYFMIIPATKQLEETREALQDANSVQQTDIAKAPENPLSGAEKLAVFKGHFPDNDAINLTWQSIASAQEKFGLVVDQSDYETSPQPEAGLLRYRLRIPLRATYPKVKGFLAEIVEANANLALESVSFERKSSDSLLVDAEVGLVVFVRAR